MSDYLFQLESHLDAAQNRTVAALQRLATEADLNAWLTGGAMRDLLRGAPFRDLDFTVERDAVRLGKALAADLEGKVVSEDRLRRQVELELPGNVTASVSNARTEKYPTVGAEPEIAPATIREDLTRRDFTINAIALSLTRGSKGLLIDPVNGQADLAGHELRSTNPYIFFDDPARLFRMIRLQHVLGFEPTPRTAAQFENALNENLHETVDRKVLVDEIRSLVHDPTGSGAASAAAALVSYDRHGMLKRLSPGFTGQKLNSEGMARLEKLRQSVLPPGTPGGWLAFLQAMTEKLTVRERAEVLKAFGLSGARLAEFKGLDARAKKLESALKSARIHRPSDVWHVLHTASSDEVLLVLCSTSFRVVQDRIRAFYEKYLPLSKEVTEDQVLATGARPGTAKFEKTRQTLIATRLNARPRKVVADPVPVPEPQAATAARGRRHG